MRLTEEEYAELTKRMERHTVAERANILLNREVQPKPKVARRESPLELELYGHLTVMGLEPIKQHKFHEARRWRLDFAFPDVLIGVEVDGGIFAAENGTEAGRHARGMGRCKDFEKRNAAAELGWAILCYGPPQVRSGEAALQVERIVRARRAARELLEQKNT